MRVSELDTFIYKFKNLWQSGYDAHLSAEAHAGKAWVRLGVQLGQAPGPLHDEHQVPGNARRARDSPSRQRRRARRTAARDADNAQKVGAEKVQNEEAENTQNLEAEKVIDVNAEEVDADVSENIENVGIEDAIDVDAEEANIVDYVEETAEDAVIEVTEVVNNTTVDPNEKVGNVVVTIVGIKDEIEKGTNESAKEEEKHEKQIGPSVTEVVDEVCPDNLYNTGKDYREVEVSATAVFENTPSEFLSKEDFESVEKVILGKNHLRENILKLDAGQQSSRKCRSGLFRHTVDLKILVKTENLWENARSYIWRNLGQNEWKKGNGATLTIDRIHVKN